VVLVYWYLTALSDGEQNQEAMNVIEQFERNVSLDDDLKLIKIKVLNSLDRTEEALSAIGKFPKDTKLKAGLFFENGRALHDSKRPEAIKAYQASIDAEPNGIYAAYASANQAEIYYAFGDWDNGHRAFEKAIALKPSEADFPKRWTMARLESGDLSELGEVSANGLKKSLESVTEGFGSIIERLTDKLQQLPKPTP
jgi:tetratricopeptide (TPR) repeat protein